MRGVISGSPAKRQKGFHRFLKPGALARLRDSKINARSSRLNSLLKRSVARRVDSPLSQDATQTQMQISTIEEVPEFLSKIHSPYSIWRKKLAAARSVSMLNLSPSGPSLESSGGSSNHSLIGVLNNDFLLAH